MSSAPPAKSNTYIYYRNLPWIVIKWNCVCNDTYLPLSYTTRYMWCPGSAQCTFLGFEAPNSRCTALDELLSQLFDDTYQEPLAWNSVLPTHSQATLKGTLIKDFHLILVYFRINKIHKVRTVQNKEGKTKSNIKVQ